MPWSNHTSPEREKEILDAIKSGISTCLIIKIKKTSGRLITKLKKKHGLWGA